MGIGNFLQGLAPAIDPNSQLAVAPLAMPQVELPQLPAVQTNAPGTRSRRSVLDTIGQISDVLAKVGGAQALYQPTLDGREDRELALADHARTVDMDALRKTLLEQNVAAGETTAQTGHNEVLGRIAQATLAYPEERRAEVFSALAQRAGITPEQMAGMTPELMQGAATAFTDKPDYGRQIAYDRTDPNNPRAYVVVNGRPQFLDGVTPALPTRNVDTGGGVAAVDPLTGRPVTRIIPKTERPGAAADRTSRERIAAGQDSTRRYVADTRPTATSRGRGGGGGEGGDLTNTQRGAVRQTYEAIPAISRTLARVEALSGQMEREGTVASGFLGGRVPGALSGKTAGEFDKAQSLLMAQIRTLIRTTGEGSMSDYESRLNAAVSPARTDSAAGRTEAINNLRGLLTDIRAKSARLLGPSSPAAAPRRTGTLTPTRRVTPATPRGGGGGGWSVVGVK